MRRSGVRSALGPFEDGRAMGRTGRPRARRVADGAEVGAINTPVNTPGVDRPLEVS